MNSVLLGVLPGTLAALGVRVETDAQVAAVITGVVLALPAAPCTRA